MGMERRHDELSMRMRDGRVHLDITQMTFKWVGGIIQVGDSVAFRPLLRPLLSFSPASSSNVVPVPRQQHPHPPRTQLSHQESVPIFLFSLAEEQAGGQLARWAEDQGGVEGEGGRPYVASAGAQDTRTLL